MGGISSDVIRGYNDTVILFLLLTAPLMAMRSQNR